MENKTYLSAINNSIKISNNENLNKILFIIIICVSIPSILINLFAIYRLYPNKKLSVFVFRCILHVSLFTTCTCIGAVRKSRDHFFCPFFDPPPPPCNQP